MKAVLVALTLLAAMGVACAQVRPADTLDDLRELVRIDSRDRFDRIVEFMAGAPEEEARLAYTLFQKADDAMSEEATRLWRAGYAIPEGEEQDRHFKEVNARYAVIARHKELSYLGVDGFNLVRKLRAASVNDRKAILKELSSKAHPDFVLEPDDVYWGPSCGTYDHDPEYRIEWAARHYPAEAIAALGEGAWDGRRFLMLCLYERNDRALKAILLRLASDRNTLVRGTALLSLARFSGEDADSAIEKGLNARFADTRAKALSAAGKMKLARVAPRAEQLLFDPVDSVKSEAIEFFGKLGTPRAVDVLIDRLKKDPERRYV